MLCKRSSDSHKRSLLLNTIGRGKRKENLQEEFRQSQEKRFSVTDFLLLCLLVFAPGCEGV